MNFDARFKIVLPNGSFHLDELAHRNYDAVRPLEFNNLHVRISSTSNFEVVNAFAALEGKVRGVELVSGQTTEISYTYETNQIPEPTKTTWTLYSSGTSGTPKATQHSLRSLIGKTHKSIYGASLKWAQLYDPNKMAGVQVILQAMVSGGVLLAPEFNSNLNDKLEWLAANHVNSISATPSLWRRIIQSGKLSGVQLKQITLGGEIADQKILDSLRVNFPESRITHVYASTEAGVGFSVKDGLAGFPIDLLDDSGRESKIRIIDSHLYLFNPESSEADAAGFVATGDLVEKIENRFYFKGRSSGQINVAGSKVWPEEVESALLRHPSIQQVIVNSKNNAFSGNIIVATVVTTQPGSKELSLELREFARSLLPAYAVPALIKFVDEIEISDSGKARR